MYIMFLFIGALYGGGSDLFYSQFDLHTKEQKINQIILLEVRGLFKFILKYCFCQFYSKQIVMVKIL